MNLEKIYLLIVIILTGTMYAVLGSGIILAVSLVVLTLLFLKDLNSKFNGNLLVTYAALTGFLGFILLIHFLIVPLSNDLIPYLTLFFRFILMGLFFVYIKNKGTDFGQLLQGVLKWIAYHAVIAFILSFIVAGYLFEVNSEDIHSSTFFYLFFYNSKFSVLGITIYRNQGLFWEPGILQVYMNILFFISSFVIRNKKLQFLAAFLILTTYSTTGIGLLLVQLIGVLFLGKGNVLQKISLLLVLLTVAVPIFIINSSQKVNDDSSSTDKTSSAFRLYDFVEGVNITRQYPLTGIGLSEQTYKAVKSTNNAFFSSYSQEFTDIVLNRRSSNSVMYFLTRFGIPFSICCFIVLYKQTLFSQKRWLFFLIIIISNLSEPLLTSPFFILIAASGYYSMIKLTLKTVQKPNLTLEC